MMRYALGIDFGSLSARALLVNIDTGEIRGTSVSPYCHAIIQDRLPDGDKIPPSFVLQMPSDYRDSFTECIKTILKDTGTDKSEIKAMGICSTASTVLPVLQDGTPLCELERFRNEPHAYIKMWKHRGAVQIAERMKESALIRNERWFKEYGGVVTCEWLPPKALEIAIDAPDVYDSMDRFIEVSDWIVQWITGTRKRSSAMARCNSMIRDDGMPTDEYYGGICSKASHLYRDKLACEYGSIGQPIGYLLPEVADLLGLQPGIPVAPAVVDSQAAVLSSGACCPGDMTFIVGTSGAEILLQKNFHAVKGIHISAFEAALPGLYSMGGGQSCLGDGFDWFVRNCIPYSYMQEAMRNKKTLHGLMMEKAGSLKSGPGRLLALDWWNGQRSPNFEFTLTGCILGMTLSTRPEEIYKAILEASAYGVRRVVERLKQGGCSVDRIFASGGIPLKNKLLMQICADVLNQPISISDCEQTGAMGSAMQAALAMGIPLENVMEKLTPKAYLKIMPDPHNAELYDKYYDNYLALAAFFENNDSPMRHIHRLSHIS